MNISTEHETESHIKSQKEKKIRAMRLVHYYIGENIMLVWADENVPLTATLVGSNKM